LKKFIQDLIIPISCQEKYNKDLVITNEDNTKNIIIKKEYTPLFWLYIDSIIYINIYYGIIQLFHPYIYNHHINPSVWFTCFLFITLWFFYMFLYQFINNKWKNRKL